MVMTQKSRLTDLRLIFFFTIYSLVVQAEVTGHYDLFPALTAITAQFTGREAFPGKPVQVIPGKSAIMRPLYLHKA